MAMAVGTSSAPAFSDVAASYFSGCVSFFGNCPLHWQLSQKVSSVVSGRLPLGIGCTRWSCSALDGSSGQLCRAASRGIRLPAKMGTGFYAAISSKMQSGVLQDNQVASFCPDTDPNSITEWELDFCSRPLLDERGKKLWELLVCDSKRRLQFSRFYRNNEINSITLRDAISYIMETTGLVKPQKIRFFRSQMQTIISKACLELDIQPIPSQRCITLIRWLEERYELLYPNYPGFQEGGGPSFQLQESNPSDLPDPLRGEKWAFVQLPLSGVLEEVIAIEEGSIFGSFFQLETLGLALPLDSLVPGVAIASSRATPLAAWTNALELSSLRVDRQRCCLVLSSGISDRWLYGFYRKSIQTDQEAEAWEAAKTACGGLHFLAVQKSLDSDDCTGFWLLFDCP